MARQLTAFLLLTLASGCAHRAAAEPAVAKSDPDESTVAGKDSGSREADESASSDEEAASTEAIAPSMGRLGDYYVYRFSGSFNEEPVTLTEQVVALEDDVLVVDFVLEAESGMRALRVRVSPDGQVASVAKIGPSGEEPGTLADYEALIEKTQLAVDRNEETVGTDDSTCLVGEEELDCRVTTYVVSLGDREATMTVSHSDELPERDLGGEITAADGTILYRATLVEHGNEAPVTEALAQSTRFSPDAL